ncbi:Ig-like domain-containing protein, partial [Leifsonia aquatica]|uniref:Ig-like domain-containing protein n=1 Tax=Leifsonia aquatica TaxID=144185 RepID=UPI00384DEE88
MKKTIKKRAGRAAVAGTTLLGLTAAGLAFAAPASAADNVGMVVGPLATATAYIKADGISSTGYTDLAAGVSNGTIPTWTYPSVGTTGTISLNGKCIVSPTVTGNLTTVATCDDTVLRQVWQGQSTGTNFLLKNVSSNLYLDPSVSAPRAYLGASSLQAGYALTAPVTVAPSLASPLPKSEITPDTVFTGEAEQGTIITVLDKDAKVIGSATAGADKTWSLTLDPAPINGTHELTIVALGTDGKSVPLASGTYTMTQSDEARAYTGPTSGTITPDTAFTGTGAKGETVVIKDGTGTVLGTATVGDDGHWSTTLNPVPTNGAVDLVVEITGADGIAEQLADNSYTMTGSEEPNTYTGPKAGDIVTPDTVFTGTGTKGETVTITDDKGNTLGSTVIGDDGQWSLSLNPAPINGDHNLTVTIGDETVATPKVVMTGSDEARSYTGPAAGASITPDTAFTGTGGKGETVVITDSKGNVLGETTVGTDGQWSLTLNPAPRNGDVALTITVGGEKVADANLVMTGSEDARTLATPASDSTITPDTVFSGNGVEGDTVVIKDSTGKVLGSV